MPKEYANSYLVRNENQNFEKKQKKQKKGFEGALLEKRGIDKLKVNRKTVDFH